MVDFHFSPRENQAHLIKWRHWDEQAFQDAQRDNKLILLSIGAVWCHWCHVMDEEAYSDEKNITLINDKFIPIKVDTDRQPDVNRRYNMGGWPTTAILTPDGELLQGGTYLTSKRLHHFLSEINRVYQDNSQEIRERVREFYQQQHLSKDYLEVKDLNEEIIVEIKKMILEQVDQRYGGFGIEPKFPHTEALEFILEEYYQTRDEELAKIIDTTLTNMAGGGMFDREAGGFFRYSTTRDWSVPHFEKMLEDNAKLLGIYLKAYQIFNQNKYKEIALDVIMYIKDWLTDHQQGVFYGSQDADEEYYVKTRAERENFKPPYVDKTIYTSWNGFVISAFIQSFAVLDALECRDIALQGLDFLLKHCYRPGEGMYHYYIDGKGYNTGLLEDQLSVMNALIDAYEITHLKPYLETACELADLVIERFYDDEAGGFYVDLPEIAILKRMTIMEKPLTINSCLAKFYLRLEVLTGDADYGQIALDTLRLYVDEFSEYGLFAAPFGSAISAYLSGITLITIIGEFDHPTVNELFNESLKVYSNYKIVEELDPILDNEKIRQLGYDLEKKQAYICKGKKCYPPIEKSEEISKVLAKV